MVEARDCVSDFLHRANSVLYGEGSDLDNSVFEPSLGSTMSDSGNKANTGASSTLEGTRLQTQIFFGI